MIEKPPEEDKDAGKDGKDTPKVKDAVEENDPTDHIAPEPVPENDQMEEEDSSQKEGKPIFKETKPTIDPPAGDDQGENTQNQSIVEENNGETRDK